MRGKNLNRVMVTNLALLLLTALLVISCAPAVPAPATPTSMSNATMAATVAPAITALSEKVRLQLTYPGWPAEFETMKGIIQRSVAELANIEVEIIHIAPPEYWSTVATMFAGGAEPDVTFMSEPLRQYAVNGSLLALEDLIKGDPDVNIDDFYKVALGHFTYNDKLYGLPKDVNTWVVFYNEDMFEAAGLKTPWVYFQEGNWTWEVYVDLAQKLTKRDGNRVVQFGSSYPGIGGWQYSAWVFANGGQILDDSRTRCLLTDPRTVETWQFTVDLANKYKVAPSPADQDGT